MVVMNGDVDRKIVCEIPISVLSDTRVERAFVFKFDTENGLTTTFSTESESPTESVTCPAMETCPSAQTCPPPQTCPNCEVCPTTTAQNTEVTCEIVPDPITCPQPVTCPERITCPESTTVGISSDPTPPPTPPPSTTTPTIYPEFNDFCRTTQPYPSAITTLENILQEKNAQFSESIGSLQVSIIHTNTLYNETSPKTCSGFYCYPEWGRASHVHLYIKDDEDQKIKQNDFDFASVDDQLFEVYNYYWSPDENLESGNYTVELWNMETSFWNELNYGYFYGKYVKFIEKENYSWFHHQI